MRFAGKTALLTEAASDIGRAVAERLAGGGAAGLALDDVDADRLDRVELSCAVSRGVGSVADEAFWARASERLTMVVMATPLGRFAKAEDVAAEIAWLLSDEAALITGTCLVSDGGYTL